MSLNNSSSVVKCQSDQFDSISLTTVSSSSIITLSSSSIADSPLAVHEFTTERITHLLKNDPSNYKVIKNAKNNLFSVCWQVFGFPAKKSHVQEEFELFFIVKVKKRIVNLIMIKLWNYEIQGEIILYLVVLVELIDALRNCTF